MSCAVFPVLTGLVSKSVADTSRGLWLSRIFCPLLFLCSVMIRVLTGRRMFMRGGGGSGAQTPAEYDACYLRQAQYQ